MLWLKHALNLIAAKTVTWWIFKKEWDLAIFLGNLAHQKSIQLWLVGWKRSIFFRWHLTAKQNHAWHTSFSWQLWCSNKDQNASPSKGNATIKHHSLLLIIPSPLTYGEKTLQITEDDNQKAPFLCVLSPLFN